MNKLVKISGVAYVESYQIGILETPMFPNKFYAGYIKKFGNEWCPTYNGTGYYKTLEDAELAIQRIMNFDDDDDDN